MTKYCPASCAADDDEQQQLLVGNNNNNKGECKDAHERCQVWADLGECNENAVEMEKWCPKACGVCGDDDENCRYVHCLLKYYCFCSVSAIISCSIILTLIIFCLNR